MIDLTKEREIKVLGIDLAKSSFQLHGANESGRTTLKKTLTRQKLKEYVVNLEPCLVAM